MRRFFVLICGLLLIHSVPPVLAQEQTSPIAEIEACTPEFLMEAVTEELNGHIQAGLTKLAERINDHFPNLHIENLSLLSRDIEHSDNRIRWTYSPKISCDSCQIS